MKLLNLFTWVTNLVEAFTFYGGGGDGGGSSAPQTSTSYSTNLPEYAQPYYQELMKQTGKQVYQTDASGNVTGVKPMPTYTGERIAGFTPGQEAIQREVSGLTLPGGFGAASSGLSTGQTMGFGAGAAGLGQAFGYSPMAISGGTFDAPAASYYMSPYQTGVTDIAVREAEKQRDLARTGRMTGALGRGTFGGARQTLADVEAERGAAQGISDIRTRGQQEAFMNAQQQFERDQARRIQAAQLGQQAQQYQAGLGKDIGLAGLTTGIDASGKQAAVGAATQTANLERLKAQASTENEKQALQQQINDLKYQTFQEQQNYQKQQLEYLSNILRGNAAALGSTQVQYTPQPSTISQIGGLGLAGLGLANVLGKG
jgi:hypothetical protein